MSAAAEHDADFALSSDTTAMSWHGAVLLGRVTTDSARADRGLDKVARR